MMVADEFVFRLTNGSWELQGSLKVDYGTFVSIRPKFLRDTSYLYYYYKSGETAGDLWYPEIDREKPLYRGCFVSPNEQWALVQTAEEKCKAVILGKEPKEAVVRWEGSRLKGFATDRWGGGASNLAFSQNGTVATFPGSPTAVYCLLVDSERKTVSHGHIALPDGGKKYTSPSIRLSPKAKWVVVKGEERIAVCDTTKPIAKRGSRNFELDREFTKLEQVTFDDEEGRIMYCGDGVRAIWNAETENPKRLLSSVSPHYQNLRGKTRGFVAGNRFLDIRDCPRADVFESCLTNGWRDHGYWWWLMFHRDAVHLLDVTYPGVAVWDTIPFKRNESRQAPKIHSMDVSARDVVLSHDGQWCLNWSSSGVFVLDMTTSYATPQKLQLWDDSAQQQVKQLSPDDQRLRVSLEKVTLTQNNRVTALWRWKKFLIAASGRIERGPKDVTVTGLSCRVIPHQVGENQLSQFTSDVLFLEADESYLFGFGRSILRRDARALAPFPAQLRAPELEAGDSRRITSKRETVVGCGRSRLLVPVRILEVPHEKNIWMSNYQRFLWDTIWRVDDADTLVAMWQAPIPSLSTYVTFQKDERAFWEITEKHEVVRYTIEKDVGKVRRDVVWILPDGEGDGSLQISPTGKWIAWIGRDDIKVRRADEKVPSPKVHVFSKDEAGVPLTGFNITGRFANDEMLQLSTSFVRLSPALDETSHVSLPGPILAISNDGNRVVVGRVVVGRITAGEKPSITSFAVYPTDLNELHTTARRLIGRPENPEEVSKLSRAQR